MLSHQNIKPNHTYATTSRTTDILEVLVLSVLALVYFVWGLNYHFHTSELWSIHISNEFFNPDFKETIWIKPLFHFILKLFYFVPLSDEWHLRTVKGLFAINGSLQIVLCFLIFKSFCTEFKVSAHFALVGLILLAINPFYMNFAFRVRSDLLATTLFLLFVYFRVCLKTLAFKYDILYLILFPIIGLKHILFSIAVGAISFTSRKKVQFAISKYFIFAMACLTGVVWVLVLGWNSIVYYLSTLQSYRDNLSYLLLWIKNDILLLVLGFLPLFFTMKKSTDDSAISKLRYLHIGALFYFLMVSQKYSFFIASLIPIFFLSSFVGILFLYAKIKSDKMAVFVSALIATSYGLLAIYNFKIYFPYHSNQDQIKFVRSVAPILHANRLSVLDGVGIFPRVPNWKCFYSPDDDQSIRYCRELIESAKAPVIILTGRLLNIVSGDSELKGYGYVSIGSGIFITSSQANALGFESSHFTLENTPDSLTNFGLEL